MRYDPKKIEAKWQKKWLVEKIYEPSFAKATEGKPSKTSPQRRPFYNLMMFPYPSAEGLHIGGMRTFTGVDIYGRMKRMQGYDVFEPIGLDAFGIHSENYALKTGRHPMKQAEVLKKNFYRQLVMMGNGFAWDEWLETNDPEYYRWTQWIFAAMFKHGLAYRKKQAVNWCSSCKTVLADEQVIAGKCERCGTIVVKKEIEQWFFRITRYADRLLKNLDTLDWSERVKTAQKEWIGKSEGAEIQFSIRSVIPAQAGIQKENGTDWIPDQVGNDQQTRLIKVFTTRPDTLFGATYLVVTPEHPLLENYKLQITNYKQAEEYIKKAKNKSEEERIAAGKEKTGVELKGVKAINPANNEEIPIFVADYVLGGYGTGAIMAVPAHDERDFGFAKKFGLLIRHVVRPLPLGRARIPTMPHEAAQREYRIETECWTGEGEMINSGQFDGTRSDEARRAITDFVGGRRITQYHLRDWLVSRQRYWGPPIPMIFCNACAAAGKGERRDIPGWYSVPEKSLPVRLPFIKEFRPTGTDQSPLASVEKFYKVRCPACKSWARRETDVSDTFLDSAWYYLRYPSVRDKRRAWDSAITKQWLPVDMYIGGAEHSVLHLLYSRFLAMAFHDWGMLDFEEPFTRFRAHGLIIKDGAKMSKSKGNVVSPDEYIRAYGADAMRMYLAFLAPFEQGGDFRDTGIRGMTRFLERVWRFCQNPKENKTKIANVQRAVHKTIKKVTEDIENLQYNTAISALMILLNEFEAVPDAVSAEDVKMLLKLLAPFAPHITEELWQGTMRMRKEQRSQSIHHEPWPQYDPRLITEQTFELVVQVNGKVRGRATLPVGASEAESVAAARGLVSVAPYLSSAPRNTIFVPNRLVNFVI